MAKNTDTGEHRCSKCGASFKTQEELREHEKTCRCGEPA